MAANIFSLEAYNPPWTAADADSLTPTRIHEMMARGKAGKLDKTKDALATAPGRYLYDQSEYDVTYYRLKLAIDLENKYIDSGFVLISARSAIDNLGALELDFYDSIPWPMYPELNYLRVDSVYDDDGQLVFAHENDKLVVELGQTYNQDEEFSFSVRHHGQPYSAYKYGRSTGDGLAFGTQLYVEGIPNGSPVAYTSCEPYTSRKWWPCKDRPDDKADSVDIYIAVDRGCYYVVSNGLLKKISQNKDGTETFHYHESYPIVTYLVSLAISNYEIITDWYYHGDNDSMPILHHVYPSMVDESEEALSITADAIGIFGDLFGEYPFIDEKYGHAHWEFYSAMEHQTCTSTMPNTWWGMTEPVVVHELAHQWWGNMITCESWHDIWLNEGFASYSEALYFEVTKNDWAYHNYMEGMEYLDIRSVYVYDTADASDVFDIVVYDKGAWVLHTLRHVVGDSTFFNLLHEYYNSVHKWGSLTTDEFAAFCSDICGQDLTEFFNDWVYGTMYPVFAYSYYTELDQTDNMYWTCFILNQAQSSGPYVFEMPIDFQIFNNSEIIKDTVLYSDARSKMFILKTPLPPDEIALDPDKWMLRGIINFPWYYHLIPFPLDTADQYSEYVDSIICRGGSGVNSYEVISGSFPAGLILDPATGEISGFPEESGEFEFKVRVDDYYGSSNDEADYRMIVRQGVGWPGDTNLDSQVDILDVIYLLNFLYKAGTPPEIPGLADPDADCEINILDVVYLINYKYKGGPAPLPGCATP